MRQLGRALSRLPVATALLAGAALLAGSAVPSRAVASRLAAAEGSDDVALAVPRMSPFGDGGGVAWPRPLPPSEAARIRRVFSLQARGAIEVAARESGALDASSALGQAMLGVLQADRYLGRFSRPDVAELRAWLNRWPDLPDAAAIHALLLARLPRGAPPPAPPPAFAACRAGPPPASRSRRRCPRRPGRPSVGWRATRPRPRAGRRRAPPRRGRRAPPARPHLGPQRGLRVAPAGRGGAHPVHAEPGRGRLRPGRRGPARLLALARPRLRAGRPRRLRGRARGLAHEPRRARAADVRGGLAFAAHHPLAARRRRVLGRARAPAHRPAGHGDGFQLWLHRAAAERDTFYGLLAQRGARQRYLVRAPARSATGRVRARPWRRPTSMPWRPPTRACAPSRCCRSTSRPAPRPSCAGSGPAVVDRPDMARAVMLVADHAGLSDLAAQLADLLQVAGRPAARGDALPRAAPAPGRRLPRRSGAWSTRWPARNPISTQRGGLRGRRPRHDADHAGHRRFITRARAAPGMPRWRGCAGCCTTRRPTSTLGQRYVGYLAGLDGIDGDLIRLLASYNCGPAQFARWAPQVRDYGDPLLFIEAIPIDETRAYRAARADLHLALRRRLRLPAPTPRRARRRRLAALASALEATPAAAPASPTCGSRWRQPWRASTRPGRSCRSTSPC